MSDPHKPVGAIFDAAIELPPERRAAYLHEACGGDDALRQRVEALLSAHESAEAFMDHPAVDLRREPMVVKPAEQPGDRIGRYKLLQQIGEGGCGVVYMAEQEEPVRRKVALKVIKLGMDTKTVIARFEAERQALALMDHPNIAKVLDGGATDTGRPYFVMELVRGVKITDYCDQNILSTQERLDLFIQVCGAIQHAHQKGIIHRDIKPSNILVTMNDGVPLPKVIDFGIAKATQGKLTDQTLFTAFEQLIGTPAYMSPEQAELSAHDIDTRSDIYSLGVLLYELLTGQTPFDAKALLKAGLDEIRRTIREQQPVRPSTRLSTMLGVELTAIAQRRKVEPPRLIHLVRGDLDWIVMKCLEKDRTRRYGTANGLAMDITRHLNCEPVLARPPSRLYEFQKTVRRHSFGFAAAALMTLVLVGATGISAWQAVRANRAGTLAKRRLAESEANATLAKQRLAESEAISKFLAEVFQSPDPAHDGRTITVAETLSNATKKVEVDLADQPARRAKLQATIGDTYYALGLYREAIPLQEKVRDFFLAASGPEHTNTLSAMHRLARSYAEDDRSEEAIKLQEALLPIVRKVKGPEHPFTLMAMNNLATFYREAGRRVEALRLQEEVLALRRKVLGPEHPDTLMAMHNLALSFHEAGRRDKALKMREQLLPLFRKVFGPEHPEIFPAMYGLADSYEWAGRRDEALKLREQLLSLYRKVLGPEHPDTVNAIQPLADSYDGAGRWDEALKMREQELSLLRKVLGPEHPDTLGTMNNLADSYDKVGRREEALKLREQTLALRRKVLGPENPDTLGTMNNLADSYDAAGRGEEALKLREDLRALRRKLNGTTHPDTLNYLASSFYSAGSNTEAIAFLKQACELDPKDTDASLTLATWQTWFGQDADYEVTRRRLVQEAEGTNQAGTAERAAKACCIRPSTNSALLAKALTLAQRAVELGKSNGDLPWYQLCLGLAEYRNGQYPAAERTLTLAEQMARQQRDLPGIARLYRAMSLSRQDKPEEARKLFSQAEAAMPPFPADERKPFVDGRLANHDVLICWLAYKEAKALIGAPSAPVAGPSAPK